MEINTTTKDKIILPKNFDNIMVFTFLFTIFWFIVHYLPSTDMPAHIQSIIIVNKQQGTYSPHFLFFFVVNLLSFFSSNIKLMYFVTVLILTGASLWKFILTKQIVKECSEGFNFLYKSNVIKAISFALLLSFAIPDFYNFFILKNMFIGRVPSIVWHNSTIISVFPFALFLFWKQTKVFDKHYFSVFDKDILTVTVLVVLNILIKPSFIFVFIPVSAFFILKKYQTNNAKSTIIKLAPMFIGGLVLLIQYISIYHYQAGSLQVDKSSIAIGAPFEVISSYIPFWYIPIALFFSFGFPIVTSYYYRDVFKYRPFFYALCLTVFGILISAFIIETGPRKLHGNFIWQNIICAYLLIITTTTFIFPKFFEKKKDLKKLIPIAFVFILHFLSGILYLIKIYFTGSYF